jgi:hypothetical protein
MEKAAAAEGVKLERLVGPKTEHKYHPETRQELERRLDTYAAKGRNPVPQKVRFATWTLRYHTCHWVRLDGLERHWSRARVEAEIKDGGIHATTENVTDIDFVFPPGRSPFRDPWAPVAVTIDGARVVARSGVVGSFGKDSGEQILSLHKKAGVWTAGGQRADGLRKVAHLQGPIDDAFLDRFIIVKPTRDPMHERTGAWAAAECDRAIRDWRTVFRGEPLVDTDFEMEEYGRSNLVLFGDPSSNRLLADMLKHWPDKLPVKWSDGKLVMGDKTYPADSHMPVLIFPNPLNQNRYVVLNSGITFREGNTVSNALQVPKLPDYAIIDVTAPADPGAPGKVVDAGFFGEKWELLPDGGRAGRTDAK